jgi:hypothetical protein
LVWTGDQIKANGKDGGEQKRLLKEEIRGSVRKTERTILRVDLLSAAAQAGRDFVMGAYFGDAGQEPEMNLEGWLDGSSRRGWEGMSEGRWASVSNDKHAVAHTVRSNTVNGIENMEGGPAAGDDSWQQRTTANIATKEPILIVLDLQTWWTPWGLSIVGV